MVRLLSLPILRCSFIPLLAGGGLLLMALSLSGCAPLIVGGVATTAVAASEERGLGGALSDKEIQIAVNDLWLRHSLDMLQRLSLTVNHGRVLITGRAANPAMRHDAVRLAWQARGVKEVINEITLDSNNGIVDSARDTWISTQLRGKLLFDRDIASVNYTVDTVNGVVYLMGVARSQIELDKVTHHARSLPYVQRVVSYVRLL